MSLFSPITPLMEIYHEEIAGWWQYPNPNQMLIEAILIQQTNSNNVALAINNLKKMNIFRAPYQNTWSKILNLSIQQLETAIYPSGFYRIKTQRIRNFAHWLAKYDFNLDKVSQFSLSRLRQELNSINGIGPETADVMILYTFKHAVFVPDNYCLQLYQKLNLLSPKITYRKAQKKFETQPDMTKDYHLAQKWHAAIDEYGKNPLKNTYDLNLIYNKSLNECHK